MIVSEADLVILAAPVGQIVEMMRLLPARIGGSAVVTDVGSTKRAIVQAAESLPARLTFVGGHPLAGAARGGFEAARPDLFAGRPWLFTRGHEGAEAALARLSEFVRVLGAVPQVIASAAEHDRLVAFLSHLPQLAASALMSVVGESLGEERLALAGRGLIDTTRLASSPADIWRDILASNGDEVGEAMDSLMTVLQHLRRNLSNGQAVDELFASANRWRDSLPIPGR
jgi:prephenate dehydrogenase